MPIRGIDMDTTTGKINLGQEMRTKLQQFKNDRKALEQQLLKNLRQYRGKYDPEIETILDSAPYQNRSKVYPRDTRVKITGFVAKMMEMMFPATEKNWTIEPTKYPNIPKIELQNILLMLQKQKQDEFMAAQQGGSPMAEPAKITSEEIERAVYDVAVRRAKLMEKEIEDQLADIGGDRVEYPQLCKKVLRSAAIYGFGVTEGPLIRSQTERVWAPDDNGQYIAAEVSKDRPYHEHIKVWDIFPDLAAKSWREQDAIIRRRVFLKNGLLTLSKMGDFDSKIITDFIKDHPDGNYTAMDYESELDTINNSQSNKNKKGRYEVFRFLGYLPAKLMSDAGVTIPVDMQQGDVLGDIWFLGDHIIKADLTPFGDNPADMYHIFVYEDDEESGLTGMGLPEVLRDSQMRLCAVDRATMDNMGAVAGPIFEVNEALLGAKQAPDSISSFQVIRRDDDNPTTANAQAVRQINTDAHISDFLAIRQVVKQTLDFESNLPSIMMGDPTQVGEAFRTSGNMSQLTGGGNMVTKDIVRSFDRFTTSFIGSLITWNMEFNPKEEIKGDYQVVAKGNMSLVAKEVRGAALDQLWTTMSPEERAIVKLHKVLVERFKSRDLPEDYIEDEDTARQILDGMRQAQAEAAKVESDLTLSKTAKNQAGAQKESAQAQEILGLLQSKIADMAASVDHKIAAAKSNKEKTQLEYIKTLIEQLNATGGKNEQGA